MSTFLELVNLARQEAGIQGGDLTSLSNLTTESNRIKGWVQREWVRVQAEHPDWQFLRVRNEFTTTPGKGSYTATEAGAVDGDGNPIMADWKRDSFRLATAGSNYADEAILGFMTFENFRNLYQYGQMRSSTSKPVVFTVDPQKVLWLGQTPNGSYVVPHEFYRTPQKLAADTDVPLMPERFHELIAFRALKAYGIFMSAPEVIARADTEISRIYPSLLLDQLPPMMTGDPLA